MSKQFLMFDMESAPSSCVFYYYSARWVTVDGIEYKRNVGIIYDMTADLPKVGQVTSIFVVNDNTVIFAVKCFSSIYVEHFRTYTLQTLCCDELVCVDHLLVPNPVHIRTCSALLSLSFCLIISMFKCKQIYCITVLLTS